MGGGGEGRGKRIPCSPPERIRKFCKVMWGGGGGGERGKRIPCSPPERIRRFCKVMWGGGGGGRGEVREYLALLQKG